MHDTFFVDTRNVLYSGFFLLKKSFRKAFKVRVLVASTNFKFICQFSNLR